MQVLRFIGLAEALRIDSLNTCVLICALLTGNMQGAGCLPAMPGHVRSSCIHSSYLDSKGKLKVAYDQKQRHNRVDTKGTQPE